MRKSTPLRSFAALATGCVALFLAMAGTSVQAGEPPVTRATSLAEFSQPLYSPDFRHFRYVRPDAPKGGTVTLASLGSFDSLNDIILRGEVPRSLGMIADSLMINSADELDVVYGLIAETVEYPADKTWIVFNLRAEARWHDGQPITAGDFVFAWQAIREHGRPFVRSFLDDVDTVEALEPRRLKVTFKTRDQIKPLVRVATVLVPQPRHWWTANGRDIARTTLEPILASGPYRIAAVDPGRSITYQRVPDYWGRDLPVNVGQNNFDTVRYDFYRDDDVMFEAFKGGAYDLRQENRAQRWSTAYADLPQIRDGRIEKRTLANERPFGAQGLSFNTRRAKFADPRVREALGYLYDFEWLQKTILYGQYQRVKSNFPNSDFGAAGSPTPEERAILEPFRGRVPERVFAQAFEPPKTDGTGNIRTNLRQAHALFKEAGWELRNGQLVHAATGEPMTIEFLEDDQTMVRVIQPYLEILKRAGIVATIRVVDSAQLQVRTNEFDFDVTTYFFNFFPPPGTEQRSYFGSEAADTKGSANLAGIRDPVVDALIEAVIAAPDTATLKATSRALDRVLLWGFYMIPQWYSDQVWLVYWNKFGWPEVKPKYDTGFPATWWHDPGKRAGR